MGNKNISLNQNNNFCLKLYNNIIEVPECNIYSDRYWVDLSHPADILNENFKNINGALANVLKLRHDQNAIDIDGHVKAFINCMDSFYDNMYNIILTLREPKNCERHVDARAALKGNGYDEGDAFSQSTYKGSKFFSDMNNQIKHNKRTVVPCNLTYRNSQKTVYGFYLGFRDKDDFMRPDKSIHEQYNGMYTGLSFSFFIKKAISLVYFYCTELNIILFPRVRNEKNVYKCENIVKPAEVCLSVEEDYFPNEYSKQCGSFKKTKNGSIVIDPSARVRLLNHERVWSVGQYVSVNDRTEYGRSVLLYNLDQQDR